MRRNRRLCLAAGLIYSLFLILQTLAPIWLGDVHWVLAAAAYLPPFTFWIPPLGLVLFGLVKRDRGLGLLGAVLLSLIALSPFGPDFQQALESDGSELKVLTWNIKHGWGGAAEVAAFVKEQDPDLALFQELQEPLVLRALKEALPGHYLVRSDGVQDLAIFSRYPLKKVEGEADFPGFFLQARVTVENTTLVVMNIHSGKASKSFTPVRSIDETIVMHSDIRRALLARINRTSEPLILGGDFNAPAAAPLIRGLSLSSAATSGGRGLGLTFPDAIPLWRLDHLLLSDEVTCHKIEVPNTHLSDHRPVIAELSIRTTKSIQKARRIDPVDSPKTEHGPSTLSELILGAE